MVEWIAALRSGKYIQGYRRLRTRDSRYCVLGVACDVIDPTRWSLAHRAGSIAPVYVFDEQHAFTMPYELGLEWYGMKDQSTLAEMNDEGKSFAEIADYLEREYL